MERSGSGKSSSQNGVKTDLLRKPSICCLPPREALGGVTHQNRTWNFLSPEDSDLLLLLCWLRFTLISASEEDADDTEVVLDLRRGGAAVVGGAGGDSVGL